MHTIRIGVAYDLREPGHFVWASIDNGMFTRTYLKRKDAMPAEKAVDLIEPFLEALDRYVEAKLNDRDSDPEWRTGHELSKAQDALGDILLRLARAKSEDV